MKPDKITQIMSNLTGTSIIGISALTNVILTGGKKNPLQGRVTKLMEGGNVMVFCNRKSNGYENMVERRLEKEGLKGTFKLGKLPWGERVQDTPFIVNGDNTYLQTIFINHPKVTYFVDGVETPKDKIQGLKLDKSEGKQGGLVDKVIVRTYKTKSIKSLRYQGKEYTI